MAENEIDLLVKEVSSAFGLSPASRSRLLHYWRDNLESVGFFIDQDEGFPKDEFFSAVRQLSLHEAAHLSQQRSLPQRSRARLSQLFLFELFTRLLVRTAIFAKPGQIAVMGRLESGRIEHLNFPEPPDLAIRYFEFSEQRQVEKAELQFKRKWIDFKTKEPPKFHYVSFNEPDEDAETRVVLNELSVALKDLGSELAKSNDRIESVLSAIADRESKHSQEGAQKAVGSDGSVQRSS